ncbi:MAG TPA: SurA N-terminal domain-containing protein [Wenzhouxiangellaceae bacterium]|nr:SurA N-terminal domain-containing protein [Wenzhouxiangellaceae bacterium]
MLQAIRDRVTGIVAIFILGLLAIPFVFFGLDSYIQSVPQDAVAQVGDSEISVSEFQTEFSRYRAQLRQQQGDAYDELQANRPEARREFLEGMIDRRLLVQHAQSMGMAISANTIAEVIRNVPAFQVDGRFDPEIYRQRMAASGQTPSAFERELATDLLIQELPAAVTSSVIVTDADVDRWLRVQMEARQISYATIPSQSFRDEISVTENEIEDFYNENQGQFMRPERVRVEYIELDTRDMAQTVEVEEDVLRQRYEATQARFMTPERRRASHILIAAGDERAEEEARGLAQSLLERLESGDDFAELATEYSDDPGSARQGGDLGWIEPDVMMPAFETALYDLQPGEVAGPVETEFGWHLIRLDEIDAPRGQTFAEARSQILEEVREERADDLYIELSERLIDLVYADPTGLDAVAEDLGLELQQTDFFSRFSAEGLMNNPRVLEAVFSDLVLVERQASEPIEIDPNHALVVRVTEHQPSEPRPLDDVADEIRSRLVRDAAHEAARAYAVDLVERVQSGDETLEQLAEAEELELEQQQATRRSFELGSQVLDTLFSLPRPADSEVLLEVIPNANNWLLVRLEQVSPGDPDQADDAQRQSALQQIRFTRSSLEFEGLLQWLRENTEISVIEQRL